MRAVFTNADWDRYARCYDALNELRPYVQMLDEVADMLWAAEYPLLDVGCGTGNLLLRLSEKCGQSVVGIDNSDAMLERAKRKCAAATLIQADIGHTLPFAADSFGTVVCVNALYALPNPFAAIREFHRLLRPGGTLIVVTPKAGYENGLILRSHCKSKKPRRCWSNAHESPEREQALVREVFPEPDLAERFQELVRFNRAIASEDAFRFFTARELRGLVVCSGFSNVRLRLTYARQNLLLVAKRSDKRRAR